MKNKKAIIEFILLLVGATELHVLNGFVCSGWANQRIAFLLEIQIIAMMYYFYNNKLAQVNTDAPQTRLYYLYI